MPGGHSIVALAGESLDFVGEEEGPAGVPKQLGESVEVQREEHGAEGVKGIESLFGEAGGDHEGDYGGDYEEL